MASGLGPIHQVNQGQGIALQTEASDKPGALGGNDTVVAKFFAGIHIGDVHLHHGYLNGANGIVNGNGGVCISAGIENNPITGKTNFMQFVHQFTFDVALVIVKVNCGETFDKGLKEYFKRLCSVNFRFTFAQQIEVRSVDDLDFHASGFCYDAGGRRLARNNDLYK